MFFDAVPRDPAVGGVQEGMVKEETRVSKENRQASRSIGGAKDAAGMDWQRELVQQWSGSLVSLHHSTLTLDCDVSGVPQAHR